MTLELSTYTLHQAKTGWQLLSPHLPAIALFAISQSDGRPPVFIASGLLTPDPPPDLIPLLSQAARYATALHRAGIYAQA